VGLDVTEEPRAERIAAAYPLIGIGRHATCGRLMMPATDADAGPVYECRVCPHRPTIPADRAHRSATRAVLGIAPKTGWDRQLRWLALVLARVTFNDRGGVVTMTWRGIRW
jgi:hypothetical protein